MSKFTQGKWEVLGDRYIAARVREGVDFWDAVARVNGTSYEIETVKANARLIAAAPEMYELLNRAFHALEGMTNSEALRFDIDACLCHVEGTPVPGEEEEESE